MLKQRTTTEKWWKKADNKRTFLDLFDQDEDGLLNFYSKEITIVIGDIIHFRQILQLDYV